MQAVGSARTRRRASRATGRRRVGLLAVLGLVLTAGLVVPVAPAIVPVPKAQAVSFPSGLQTGFQIDGNKTASGSLPNAFDWDDILSPAPTATQSPTFRPTAPYTTANGYQSSGIFEGAFFWDDGRYGNCADGSDQTATAGSQTANTNPWVVAPANVQDKNNLCSAGYATEAITDDAGTRHFMLYGYFTRRTGGTADASTFTVFEGPRPGRCDDLMLDIDWPSGATQFLSWTPSAGDDCANPNGAGTWGPAGRSIDFAFAMGQRTEGPPVGNNQERTFAEYGIDLTTAGLFGDQTCSSYTVSSLMTRSSTSITSNMADFLNNTPDPMQISNCGTLTVSKETPVGATDDDFPFTVTNESSQGVVIPPDTTRIADTVRSGQTKTYENVLSSNVLHLTETDIPPPWTLRSAVCSYTDGGGTRRSIDVTDPSTPFVLLGGGRTDCVLTNDTALVTVAKATRPTGSDQTFDFTMGTQTATLGDGDSQTIAVAPGTPITFTEAPVDGWMTPSYACDDAAGTDGTGYSVTVTPVLGKNITCTFTNTQQASVTIEKRVPIDAPETDFAFSGSLGDFSLTPSTAVGTTERIADRTFVVDPGAQSVTEATADGFTLADLSCWDDTYGWERDYEGATVSFDAQPGSVVTCAFTNVPNPQGATLIVQKATTPMVNWDLTFPFTVTGPGGYRQSFGLNTLADAWSWTAADVPAGGYTITEEQLPGWNLSDLSCTRRDGGTLGWTPGDDHVDVELPEGAVVTCLFTNEASLAQATIAKTVAGVAPGYGWSFDVALSPAGDGTARTLSGSGPGTDETTWTDLVPGTRYVIRETAKPDWTMGAITCRDANGAVEDLDSDDLTFTFVATVGQRLACAMTNTARSSNLDVTKVTTGLGPDYAWSFHVQILPLPTGSTNPREVAGTGQSAVSLGWDNLVPGQRYEVSEIDLPPQVREEFTCTGAESGTLDAGNGFWFVAPLAGTVRCTVTNFVEPARATLTKTTSSGDGTFLFDLAALGTGTDPTPVTIATDGGRGTAQLSLVPGVRYSLTERDQPGWLEGPIVCTVTPAEGSPSQIADVTDFTVRVGDTVACTARNDIAPGTVTFTKTTAGITSDLDWSFPVTLTPQGGTAVARTVSGTGPGSSAVAWENLAPGRYTVEEGGLTGWDAGAITCEASSGTVSDADPIAPGYQLDVQAGVSYTCAATNTAGPAQVTIAKRTAGIGDSVAWSFVFRLDPVPVGQRDTATLTGTGPGLGAERETWTDLVPGRVYRLTEVNPGPSWTQGPITCTDASGATVDASRLVVAPGGSYSCVADNTATPVTATVTKTTVGGDGTFTFLLGDVPSSGPATPVSVTTTGGTGSATLPTLIPGNRYSLSEAAQDGWRQTGALACTRTPLGGDPVAIPDLSDFTVAAGDAIACTAENTRLGRVVLYKEVHGTGDDPRSFGFSSNVPEHESFTVDGVVDDGQLVPYEMDDVLPGTDYYVSEDGDTGDPPTELADLSCTYGGEDHSGSAQDRENRRIGFSVLPGETTECYFTNAVPGTLILIKRSVPANFPQAFDFSITGDGVNPGGADPDRADFTINSDPSVDGALRSWSGLTGDTYTLSEGTAPAGWHLDRASTATFCNANGDSTWTLADGAPSITVDLAPADVVTCFFSNVADTASVSVTKSVAGVAAGTPWSFPLTLSPAAGVQPAPQQTVSGVAGVTAATNTATWTNLTPGVTYTLAEPTTAGWTSGGYVCTDGSGATVADRSAAAGYQFVAGVGTTLSCALTNTAQAASVAVTKTVSGVADGLPWSFQLNLDPPTPSGGSRTVTGAGNGTSSAATWSDLVPGVTYTLTETPQAGWRQGVFQCPGLTDGDPASAGFQFVATPGLTLQCGITNGAQASQVSVVKSVTGVAAGVAWSFPVTITPGASPQTTQTLTGTGSTTSAAATWTGLVPGVTYTLTEAAPAGWGGRSFACAVGGTDVPDAAPAVPGFQFVAGLDQTLACTLSNQASPAQVTVTKTVSGVADDLDWSFDVTLDPAADLPATRPLTGTGNMTSDPATWTGLVPGTTYTLTEDRPDGWTGGEVVCGDLPDADPGTAGFQFVAALDQRLSCTLTNEASPAQVSVTKTVSGVADDLDWSFDVTLDPAADPQATQTLTGTGNETSEPATWTNLVPGTTYTLAEDRPDGWTGGDVVCGDLDDADPGTPGFQLVATPGLSVTCGLTNTAQAASLSATKTVDGVGSSREWSFDLTLDPAAGSGTQTLTGTGNETSAPATWEGLVPGTTYTLTESTDETGWTAGSFECRVGGSDGPLVDDASDAPGFQLVPEPGGSYVCGVVNTRAPATGTITKTALGGDGDFDFALTPEGGPAQTIRVSTSGGTGTADLPALLPDTTYSLTEEPADGWTSQEALACTATPAGGGDAVPIDDLASFTVDPGAVLDCRATNARHGRIVVVKAVRGDDAAFDFTGTWPGGGDFSITTDGGTGSQAFDDVAPGEYTLTEAGRTGFEGTRLVCTDGVPGGTASTVDGLTGTIALDPGETVTCTYTNTQWGVLAVDKTTVPAGASTRFGFVWGPEGGTQEPFTLADRDEPFTTAPLEPGSYTVTEDGVDGWRLTSLVCTGSSGDPVYDGATATVRVAAGDTVLCRYTNGREEALTVAKSVVSGPVDLGDGQFRIGYRVTVHNPGGAAQRYDLEDRLRFGGGIRVVSASLASADVTVNRGWDGTLDTAAVSGGTIAAGATHTVRVTVTARVPSVLSAEARECRGTAGAPQAGGFLNTASVRGEVGDGATAEACSDVPPPGGTPTPTAPTTTPPVSPAPTPAGGGGGGPLATTGFAAWTTLLVAALLLAAGLLLVRRRRG
ncbi:MAG TPA: hypothetical protein VNR17_08815 [Luteimicrobium sp.]|nr:hypothetical protein [Luteimicrobium sp.]